MIMINEPYEPLIPRVPDAIIIDDCWCSHACPHLICKSNDHKCAVLGELDYYDGPLAECISIKDFD